MPDGLTLITPTSDRPAAFALCERWMARQTYRGPLDWIVVDDGAARVVPSRGQQHLRREPASDPRGSFAGNLLAGLTTARDLPHEKILFIEDDDWYAPDYLALMCDWLEGADIAGEARARYYHLPTRRWMLCPNTDRASLCQTGIRRGLLQPLLDHLTAHPSTFVDIHLWKTLAADARQLLWGETLHSVGIKGLPGKQGIGIGHRLGERHRCDTDGSVLKSWMGEDAEIYFAMGRSLAGSLQ